MAQVAAAEPGAGRGGGWQAAGFVLLALAVAGALQFWGAPVPSDADSAYHAAVGQLLRRHGVLHAFPWTPMSWLADHYADKELLFHLLFVPLAGLRWTTAAHVVGTACGAALLVALYAVLRREGVRSAWAWALLPLLASSAFLYRFVLVRPHLLSIALAVLVLWGAARGRSWVVALASLAYPWAYVAWFLPLVMVVLAEGARVLGGGRPRWQPAAAALGGMALGVALHPNGANLVRFSWLVVGEVLVRNAWGGRRGLEMGTEFAPFTVDEWGALLLLPAAMAVAALVLAWRGRRGGAVPLAFALAAVAFGALTARTARFAEYFVPLAVAALALALRGASPRRAGMVLAAAVAVALPYQGPEEVELMARLREWPNRVPSYVATAMRAGIPPGSRVFTCEWGLTGHLMLALPERSFLVALDPTLFQVKDPELYQLWYVVTRRPPPGAAQVVRERFGATHVACLADGQFQGFVERLSADPTVRTVLVSDDWNVYDLGVRP